MYSFQAKIGLEKMKKGENKNYRFVPTQREIENPKKREIKLKELKYTIMTSFKTKTGWKMQRKRKKKFIAPFRSVPTRSVIENSNKIAKKFKDLKNTFMASFLAKIGWKRMRKRQNKNYHYVSFQPDA